MYMSEVRASQTDFTYAPSTQTEKQKITTSPSPHPFQTLSPRVIIN